MSNGRIPNDETGAGAWRVGTLFTLVVLAAGGWGVAGCDRGEKAAVSSENAVPPEGVPTPAEATADPPRAPRTRLPDGPSALTVGGTAVSFPNLRALVERRGRGVGVTLYTDAPEGEGAKVDPTAGRLWLDFQLDVDDVVKVDGAEWRFKADGPERADSPDTLALPDGRQLQPYDVRLTFAADDNGVAVSVEGKYLVFDAPEALTAETAVAVRGTLRAERDK